MVGEKKLNLLVPAKNALRLSMFVENCKIYSSQMAKKNTFNYPALFGDSLKIILGFFVLHTIAGKYIDSWTTRQILEKP